MRVIVLLIVAGLLAGCGLAHKMAKQEALDKYNSSLSNCEKQYSANAKLSPLARCRATAYMTWHKSSSHQDLRKAYVAQSLLLAQHYDSGKITRVEFDAKEATAYAQMNNQITQRTNSTVSANAAAYSAANSRQKFCQRFGRTVQCF